METEPNYLPSQEEVRKVFKDFKQVLKVARYQTPLQRANHLVLRNSSIALAQKVQSEAEHVFNLLQPGHGTVHSVDFFRVLLSAQQAIPLRIPVTLLSDAEGVVLVRTNETGHISIRLFPEAPKGLAAFFEEVGKLGAVRATLPRFVHKTISQPSSFHVSIEAALQAWEEASGAEHRLQQYVLPHSKSTSLLRTHWREDKGPIYYFISQGTSGTKPLPSIVSKTHIIDRSFSEPHLIENRARIKKSTSNLVVQRLRPIPELNQALEACLKTLSGTISVDQRITEMVCDFTSDAHYEWVFLGCDGFSFKSKLRSWTQTIKQNKVVDLQCLMFPLVTRKSVVHKRLHWTNKLKTIASQQNLDEIQVASDTKECFVAPPAAFHSTLDSPEHDSYEDAIYHPRAKRRMVVNSLLSRDVSRYDSLVQESRAYKEETNNKINFVERHGGTDVWKRKLRDFLVVLVKLREVSDLFCENIGIEETEMIMCGLMRVIRGDYNFYYKEALKKVHHRKNIAAWQYDLFLKSIEGVFREVTQSEEETQLILQRFEQMEKFICRPTNRH